MKQNSYGEKTISAWSLYTTRWANVLWKGGTEGDENDKITGMSKVSDRFGLKLPGNMMRIPVRATQSTRLPTPLTKSAPETFMTFMKTPKAPRKFGSTHSVT